MFKSPRKLQLADKALMVMQPPCKRRNGLRVPVSAPCSNSSVAEQPFGKGQTGVRFAFGAPRESGLVGNLAHLAALEAVALGVRVSPLLPISAV